MRLHINFESVAYIEEYQTMMTIHYIWGRQQTILREKTEDFDEILKLWNRTSIKSFNSSI